MSSNRFFRFTGRDRIGRTRLILGLILLAFAIPAFLLVEWDAIQWFLMSDERVQMQGLGIMTVLHANVAGLFVVAIWMLSPLWARRSKDRDN